MLVKSRYIFLWFIYQCCFSIYPSIAQPSDILFNRIMPADGLSSTYINILYKDRAGYLWIGTDNGLIRFDGLNFITYQHISNDTTTLTHSSVYKILEDNNADLWITTGIGLSRYNRRKDNFTQFFFDDEKRTDSENRGFYTELFHIDNKKRLWLYLNGKVVLYDMNANKGKVISSMANGYDYTPQQPGEDLKVFVAKEREGAYVHYVDDDSVINMKEIFTGKHNMPVRTLSEFYWQNDSTLWTCGQDGIMRVNLNNYQYETYSHYGATLINANDMRYYKDNILFVATSNTGMLLFDMDKKQFVQSYTYSPVDPLTITSNKVSKIYVDSMNVFAASENVGLAIGNLQQSPFKYLFKKSDMRTEEEANAVVSVVALDSNQILIATTDLKLYRWNLASNKLVAEWNLKDITHTTVAPANMFKFKNGMVLLNFRNQIALYNQHTNQITNVTLSKNFTYTIYGFKMLANGNVVACSAGGLYNVSLTDNKILLDEWKEVNNQLGWKDIYNIFDIDQHHFAVHTRSSDLMIYKHDNFKNCIYIKHIRTPFNIYQSAVTDSSIYFASVQGLKKMTIADFTISDVSTNLSSTLNNLIYSKGKLFATNESQLIVYDVHTNKIITFASGEGMQNSRFAINSLLRLDDNRAILGGIDGITLFNPDALASQQKHFKISINRLIINDRPFADTNANYVHQIELPYNQNNVEIDISSIGFNDAANNHFYYYMPGVDHSPVMVSGRSSVQYKKLKSGTYTFFVMNTLSSAPAYKLHLVIHPPFWLTWWFILLLVVSAVAITIYIFRRRVKAYEKKTRERMLLILNSQEEERKRIARDLHDDFGARLSTLKLYIQTSEKSTGESPEILKASRQMIDDTISQLRNILLNLSPKALEENGIVSALSEVRDYINRTGLVTCHLDTSAFSGQLKMDMAFALYRINMELVNNTLKYAAASDIHISLVTREKEVSYLFEDNGKGCDLQTIHAGYGLKNIQTNVHAFGGEVIFETQQGRGFVASIEYPLSVLE